MSYEGFEEFLCVNGHYHSYDVYAGMPCKCPECGEVWKWWHAVDGTNGIVEDDPGTNWAPKNSLGHEDEWKEDHYGNKYAVKKLLYSPALINGDGVWRRYREGQNE
jgi:hypothetical protein